MRISFATILFFLINSFQYSFSQNQSIQTPQIPNIENRSKTDIKNGILNTYIRSMEKWKIPFSTLLENKAGSACIEWERITEEFLKIGIFDALGYSQDIANEKAAKIAAEAGCNKMKDYYKLGDSCTCETIVLNDKNQVIIPYVEPDLEAEFLNAVTHFKQKNYLKSIEIFEKLSQKGDGQAQYNLSYLYFKGLGHPQNYNKSLYWAWASLLSGEKKAKPIITESKERLTEEEINLTRENLKIYLEKRVYEGDINAILPLAKWYTVVSEDEDMKNAYIWFKEKFTK